MKNMLFPGRPNYEGPTSGIFGLLHHDQLIEGSRDVMERVAYVCKHKSDNEVNIRLHNMIYLGACSDAVGYGAKADILRAEYDAKGKSIWAEYDAKAKPIRDEYNAKADILRAEYDAKGKSIWAEYDAKADILRAEYDAKGKSIWAEYNAKVKPMWDEYEAKVKALDVPVLAYIRSHIPDCAWDGQTLVFSKEKVS